MTHVLRRVTSSCSFVCLHAGRSRAAARFITGAPAEVKLSSEGQVRLIALNRPERRNAVNSHTARLLFEAFTELNSDDSVHSAVLFGIGGNFCAGYDLKELAGGEQKGAGELLETHITCPPETENPLAPMVCYNTCTYTVIRHKYTTTSPCVCVY